MPHPRTTVCFHCKVESTIAHYQRVVDNKTELHGPWAGWRMSGRHMIAPGNIGRITPELLAALLVPRNQRAHLFAKARPQPCPGEPICMRVPNCS